MAMVPKTNRLQPRPIMSNDTETPEKKRRLQGEDNCLLWRHRVSWDLWVYFDMVECNSLIPLRDSHFSEGKTVAGFEYGQFLTPYLQFITEDTDINTQVPGPKTINSVSVLGSQIHECPRIVGTCWHTKWLQAKDPIIPFLDSVDEPQLCARGQHTPFSVLFAEGKPFPCWDEVFGMIAGVDCNDELHQLHSGLYLQCIRYKVLLRHWYYSWYKLNQHEYRSPHSIRPGNTKNTFCTLAIGHKTVVNVLDGGMNVIWSNIPKTLHKWLHLVSAPGPRVGYKSSPHQLPLNVANCEFWML